MKELIDWLKKNVGDEIRIVTPQFERTEPLDFDWIPQTAEQFYAIVEKAPWNILKGLGFGKWDSMNNLIAENSKRKQNDVHRIPFINKPEEDLVVDMSKRTDVPSELLEVDEDVILIPGEWYNIIPDGFIVTGLYGEQHPFKKGESDDDIRFGCLPYGIRRVINST